MSFEIPEHLQGEPFVKELIQEINALVNENSVLHQRLKIQSSTIDKLLLEKKQNNNNSNNNNNNNRNTSSNGEVKLQAFDAVVVVEEALYAALAKSPPRPPPTPPESPLQTENKSTSDNKKSQVKKRLGGGALKVASGKRSKPQSNQKIRAKPVDALVMLELERLHLLKKTGKTGKFPDTFAARIHKREKKREKHTAAIEDRARYHDIQYSEDGEPVNDGSLYEKTMRTSPMKQVEPSGRNETSNMSHKAHLKGAKANHAHEIMSADTVAKRAQIMSEKTLKNMAFGRRASAAVGRHGYQLMHHKLGAESFMGESYAGNLSPFSHADSHQQQKLEHVQEQLKLDKIKRSKKNLQKRYNRSNNSSIKSSSNSSLSKKSNGGPIPKAFGRRVSVAGSRSAHLVTHHLLGADAFVGEHYNQYHSVQTGRMDKRLNSPPPNDITNNKSGNMTLEEIAETDDINDGYEYE